MKIIPSNSQKLEHWIYRDYFIFHITPKPDLTATMLIPNFVSYMLKKIKE